MDIKKLFAVTDKSVQRGVGGSGEDFVARALKKDGYKIKALNWYNPRGKRLGEIDIVCEKDDEIVFMEVKSRRVLDHQKVDDILPEEQVSAQKLRKLDRVARAYLEEYSMLERDYRFDVFAVVYDQAGSVQRSRHMTHIFI